FYRESEFPVLQCVWPDKKHVFPWEPGFDTGFFRAQRVLGPVGSWPEGWPFPDPPNLAVFTTRKICEATRPILLVSRDDEGSWQFLTGEPVTASDLLIIGLGEAFALDASLGELGNLQPGWQARRDQPGSPWQPTPMNSPST